MGSRGRQDRQGPGAGRARRRLPIFGLAAALGLTGPLHAGAEEESVVREAGLGAGAALANVLYIPVKLVYATTGGIVGGFAYVLTLGDSETAQHVWEPTLGGSYVVTPKVLTGEEPLRFSGGEPAPQEAKPKAGGQWPE